MLKALHIEAGHENEKNIYIYFCLTINWCHEKNLRFQIRYLVSHFRYLVKKDESCLTSSSQFPLFGNNHKINIPVVDTVPNISFPLVNLSMTPTRVSSFAKRKHKHREAVVTCILFLL